MSNTQSDNQMQEGRRKRPENSARKDGALWPDNPIQESQTQTVQAMLEKMETMRTLLSETLPAAAAGLRGELSNLYLASQRLIPDEQREACPELDMCAARMDQSYFRLLRMINNMNAATYLRDKSAYHMEPWDIVEIVGKICDESGDLAVWKNISLNFQCAIPRHVAMFDRAAIKLVLYHLLSNALKYTPSGGAVTVSLRIADGHIYLEVSDTGRGMTNEEQIALFDRCLYLNQTNAFPNGLGLGIPLCHSVARNHNGMIVAVSKPGKGSVFIFSMPDNSPKHYNIIRQHEPFQAEDSGFNPTLLALSDAMPTQAFRVHRKD